MAWTVALWTSAALVVAIFAATVVRLDLWFLHRGSRR